MINSKPWRIRRTPLPDWRTLLPENSSWWFLVDRYFAHDPLLTVGFATTNAPVKGHAQKEMLRRDLPVAGVPMILSGWSFTLTDLLPWSRHQLLVISALMAIFDATLLALLYRDWRLWLIQIATLIMSIGGMIASMKLLHIPLNLLNVLAFRLVLAIGVDYGIYVLLVWQKARELDHDVAGVVKPVVLAGLTAIAGFGSLGIANNPTLSGLGIACAIGFSGVSPPRSFSLYPQPRRLNRSSGAKNLCSLSNNPKMSKLLAISCFILLSVSSAAAQSLSPADMKGLLERIREKRAAAPQVQADFQEEKNVHMLNKPITSSGKVWFQAPNKFRREAKGNSPSITVSDGQQLWIYYPKFQSAEHYSLGKRSPLDAGIAAITAGLNLENVEGTYHITGNKSGNGYQLELTPRNPSMKRFLQKFTIQLSNDLQVERTEMLQPNGDHIVTIYSNETRAPIPPSTFEFTPPAGTNVTTPLGSLGTFFSN